MNTIWLNITTTLNWKRPVVGIVRVETECTALALEDENIKFCKYDSDFHRYREVKRSEVISAIEKVKNYKNNSAPAEEEPVVVKMGKIKRSVFKFVEIFPESYRRYFYWLMSRGKKAAKILISPVKRLWSKLKRELQNEHDIKIGNAKDEDIFSTGDTYLSLGLDWDNESITYLYRLKEKYKLKIVLCCYDTIPVKYPHYCIGDVASEFAKYLADLAWCADKILCISKCTKNDLENLLNAIGAPVPELKVFTLGSEIKPYEEGEISKEVKKLLGKEYILYVSTIERRKNHETLYKTYIRILEKREKVPTLVFVGMNGWGINDLMSDIKLNPRVGGNIVILNYVSDYELSELYKRCLFTVYPSLYEGWGLPVAESLEYGKFCLASNVASIPEVGGNLIEYLDPWNVQEWVEKIEYYFDNRDKLAESEKIIKEKYKTQKWHDTAREVFRECKVFND
jgi:glycosyltransferase involved in cell wall biosynthesis